MNRSVYYERMKELARQIRAKYELTSPRVMKSHMREIYNDQGIKIDLWSGKLKNLRGAYFNDKLGASVLIARSLPYDPMIFTLAHELKHHLEDRDSQNTILCDLSNENELIEISAEVFAAELIFPEQDFIKIMHQMEIGYGECCPKDIVRMKKETETTLSYTGLAKKAEFLNFANPNVLRNIKWKKLEEKIYGEPVYKQIQRYQKRKKI